jgi:hypothetical protein
VPLPWAGRSAESLAYAWAACLAALGLVLYLVLLRKRAAAVGLLVCLLLVPLAVGTMELLGHPKHAEQSYAWDAWYLLWPHALTVPLGWGLLAAGLAATWLALRWLRPPARERRPVISAPPPITAAPR